MKTSLFIAALACVVFLNESRGQQISKPSSDASLRQTVQAQSKAIADLTERVAALEAQLQKSAQISKRASVDLSAVKRDLSGFDDGCKSEQDRAAAMALAQNLPAMTYMGGAAMNCTERLKKITDHLVDSLESQ